MCTMCESSGLSSPKRAVVMGIATLVRQTAISGWKKGREAGVLRSEPVSLDREG